MKLWASSLEVAFCCLLLATSLAAQTPHLTGTIDIDIEAGILTGDVCLSDLPGQAAPAFYLNHGLNIKFIRGTTGDSIGYSGYYDGHLEGESMQYQLDEDLHGVRTVCVNYTGAFPVYARNENTFEFKGLIAFIGHTFRATEQSAWYPVFYETATRVPYPAMTYDLTIRCPSCSAIYLNGSQPRYASHTRFVSTIPRPLFIFAGRYSFARVGDITFINGQVSSASAGVIGTAAHSIARYYEGFMGIPLPDTPVFLTFQSVDRHRPRGKNTITFATWPTLAFDGEVRFDTFVKSENGQPVLDDIFWHTLAHEMAHYYFGTLLRPQGDYNWFYTESTAEYMALKAVQRLRGREAFARRLSSYYKDVLSDPSPVALDQADAHTTSSDSWYYYWPMLLLSLEENIGENRMQRVMSEMLRAPASSPRDFVFLRRATLEAGAPQSAWDHFEQECVRRPPAQGCLKQLVDSQAATAPR